MTLREAVMVVVALGMVASACGTDTGSTTTSSAPPAATTTVTAPPDTSTVAPTTTMAATTTTTLPGEPFDIVPAKGATLAVIGVEHDDVLNVRSGPGVSYDVIATLEPTSNRAVSLGEARLLPGSIWWAVDVDGTAGWVRSSFTAQLGAVDDLTSFVVDRIGSIPEAADMTALGLVVAEALASTDPQSSITLTEPESVGDLGEVTYDLVGLGDDALAGYRLHVFGQATDGGFALKSVEATLLCDVVRGVTDGGFCT